jgi:hypothetical protein
MKVYALPPGDEGVEILTKQVALGGKAYMLPFFSYPIDVDRVNCLFL